jgi:hypothetical protein
MTVSDPQPGGASGDGDAHASPDDATDSGSGTMKKKKKGPVRMRDQDSATEQVVKWANFHFRLFLACTNVYPSKADVITTVSEAWTQACNDMGVLTLLAMYVNNEEYNQTIFKIVCTLVGTQKVH